MQGGIQLGATSPQACAWKAPWSIGTARIRRGARLEETFSLVAKSPPRLMRHWHHAPTSRIRIPSALPLFRLRCSVAHDPGSVWLIKRSARMGDRDVKQSVRELVHPVGPHIQPRLASNGREFWYEDFAPDQRTYLIHNVSVNVRDVVVPARAQWAAATDDRVVAFLGPAIPCRNKCASKEELCGELLDPQGNHAVICGSGPLRTRRHNDIADTYADIVDEVEAGAFGPARNLRTRIFFQWT